MEEILADILDESSIINPVHSRRIELLKEKRLNSSISDFLIRLKKIKLIEYENMTGDAFLTHIFSEEVDAQVKQTEASLWYNHGGSKSAKQVREARWCATSKCLCRCSYCNALGHQIS